MPESKPIVGIDLGGTNVQIGIVNGDHKVIARAKRKSKPEEGREKVLDRIADGVTEACAEAGIGINEVGAIGIGAPGAVDRDNGVVLEAVNLRWNNVALADLLSKRLGGRKVFIDNDVNVAVYGENKLGAGENSRDLLGVWIGTGIGGGLILNGELYQGTFMSAGEIGHTTLFPGGALGTRSLEQNCSRTAIVERLIRLIKSNHKSALVNLVDGDLSEIKSKTIAKAYEMGDELTVQVVENVAEMLGVAIASTVTLLSLGRVVLGGGFTEAMGGQFVDHVKRAVRAHVFPAKARAVKVVGTKLADDAGVTGAALIASERVGKR